MNVLDENMLESQRELLLKWHVPFRQIGYEIGRKGMKDEPIIRLLHNLRQPTLFTLDGDFYKRNLCHVIIGQSVQGRLLVVVHTIRGDNVRIISARVATPTERKNYEEGS